jgi:hypothetical protein
VRHAREDNLDSDFSIHAQFGNVTIKRVTEEITLKPDEHEGFGERTWLKPGDIIQLTRDIEFIFDPQ